MSRYVVRGKDANGRVTTAAPDPAEDDRIDGHLPATDGRFSTFATIDDAEQARRDLVGWGCTDVRIYDAETGAVVPTYAEALARLEQIDAALAGAFAIVPCNNSQPRVFIRGAGVELVRHQRALADMRLPDNVADAEAILASAATALQAAIREEPSHPNRMTRDLQDYPQGAALHVVPELADEVDEHRATKEKLAEADKYIATQDEQIEALETALAARSPLTDAQVEGFAQTAMDDICKGTERPRNAVARAIRAALNAAGPEVPTPDPAARAESGPMRFGDDWAGVFLRGDYAGPMAMYLGQALDMLGASDPIFVAQLRGLASTLSGCDERGALTGLQQMRPFAACVAHGTATPTAEPTPKERDYARCMRLWKAAGERAEQCGDRRDSEGCDDADYDQQNYAIAIDIHSGADRAGSLAELRRRYDVLAGYLMLRGGTNFMSACRGDIAEERWGDLVERIANLEWEHVADGRLRWTMNDDGVRVAEPVGQPSWHIPADLDPGHPFDASAPGSADPAPR